MPDSLHPLTIPPAAYRRAQRAMADLKASVVEVLFAAPSGGLQNSVIGRSLGIYAGHQGHEGHISRTILHLLEAEGVAGQDKVSKQWTLRQQVDVDE